MKIKLLHGSAMNDSVSMWYKIRDTFFGFNNRKLRFFKALTLAAKCSHPSAVWLTSKAQQAESPLQLLNVGDDEQTRF
jgi:hypothetical protein